MENFVPQTFSASDINDGARYQNGDIVSAEAINAPIEAALLMQSLASNTPVVETISTSAEPTVTIEAYGSGYRFKFRNIKGAQGERGLQGQQGATYTLKETDKTEIANMVISLLPTAESVSF